MISLRRRAPRALLAALALFTTTTPAIAQGTLEDYQRAERFLPWNVQDLLFGMSVEPNWTGEGDRFWYRSVHRDGTRFWTVDPSGSGDRIRTPTFDHDRLAQALTAAGLDASSGAFPFERFDLEAEDGAIFFEAEDERWRCDLDAWECHPVEIPDVPVGELTSPDGRWVAFVRGNDLRLRSTATEQEFRLTHDGEPGYGYGAPVAQPEVALEYGTTEGHLPFVGTWSPDSKRLVSVRIDEREAPRFHWVESVPGKGTSRFGYAAGPYPLPGDLDVPKAELAVFDVEELDRIPVDTGPLPVLYFGPGLSPAQSWWSEDGRKFYFIDWERGYSSARLIEVDTHTGEARTLIEEHGDTWVDLGPNNWEPNIRILGGGQEILWWSQRDEWGHLYLYDVDGRLQRRLTGGRWVVREIHHVDEENRWLYFTAGGKEAGRDPYLRHLYRVHLDRIEEPHLLTPEDGDHQLRFSPTGEYFVDNYSRVDAAPRSVLRRSRDGAVLVELERADLAVLLATGWSFPEPFRAKARDGQTDIYGLIVFPTNAAQGARLPVIDYIYAGPQRIQTPKSLGNQEYWSAANRVWEMQTLAELGFAVVTVDGLGTPYRSKPFHDVTFRNLGDAGIDDHVAAIRQLGARHSELDLDRVGIFGHSAGGYASAHAMLVRPDFYKVAVSSAGNHDHRTDKASWVERYMGFPVGPHYEAQANPTLAARLEGKLLLAHGELDTNVHPAATFQLVDALVAANKDHDLIFLPGRPHGFGADPYFARRRWDYFVEHLLGVTPPEGYRLRLPSPNSGP